MKRIVLISVTAIECDVVLYHERFEVYTLDHTIYVSIDMG